MAQYKQMLNRERNEIESIDAKIIRLLISRFIVTRKVQAMKTKVRLPITDKTRERTLVAHYRKQDRRGILPKGFLKKLFNLIFLYSKKPGIIKRTKRYGTKW